MTKRQNRIVVAACVACVVLGTYHGIGAYRNGLDKFPARLVGIMGTECELTAIAPRKNRDLAGEALRAAEGKLRRVEVMASTFIDGSFVSHLNAAPPGQEIPYDGEMPVLLDTARRLSAETDGAFDVTYQPVFTLWKRSGKASRLPGEGELAIAVANSGWDKFELTETGVIKRLDGASIDLGGIAKGFAIDRAVDEMRRLDIAGGLVDVGGDIRCFGETVSCAPWKIGIRDPFPPHGMIGTLAVADCAVCTSGNYERFTVIAGRRYSHIIDPRTGRPVDSAPSVTVVAPTAAIADAWATALSVLGPGGLAKLPVSADIQAMIVVGTPEKHQVHVTEGFAGMLSAKFGWLRKAKIHTARFRAPISQPARRSR